MAHASGCRVERKPTIKLFCTGEPLRDSLAADLVTKGWPVANTWFYILDEEQREVEPVGTLARRM
jgi:hypothetical protein